jgi:hypothetical protein
MVMGVLPCGYGAGIAGASARLRLAARFACPRRTVLPLRGRTDNQNAASLGARAQKGLTILADAIFTAFRLQAGACRLLGSPLYAQLLEAALADLRADGPMARLVEGFDGDPLRGFLPLRVLGAVHERALAGESPELARFYPSLNGRPEWPAVWEAFRELVRAQREALLPGLASFPQTNEVRRCSGLLGGFLQIARETRLPLRLREMGASAGLNLSWDRYHYTLAPHGWGDPGSPVRIEAEWRGPPAAFEQQPAIESRAGCDLAPVRIDDPAKVRWLEAYVWADQPERLAQLRAAIALAREDPPRVARESAAVWLERELREPVPGVATVVFHSAVWGFLPAEEQARVRELLHAAGSRASAEAPFAWLSHEDETGHGRVTVRLRLWPGGKSRALCEGHPHGRLVRWGEPPPRAPTA